MEKVHSEKCEICLERPLDPKLLPCFHIACRECVRNLFVKGKKEIKCPVEMCRKSITCKNNDPEFLPDALFIYHKRDSQILKSRAENQNVICELCIKARQEEFPAEAFCDQCSYICTACSRQHENEVQYSDHNVASFLELSNKGDDVRLNVLRRARTMSKNMIRRGKSFCEMHPENEQKSYCLDCQVQVCSLCIDDSHSTHKYKAFNIAAKECRDHLKEGLPSLSSSAQSLEEAVVSINSRKAFIESQREDLESAIDDSITRMTKLLKDRQKKLHQRLKTLTDSKLYKLDEQKKSLERLAGEMRRREFVTSELLRTSTEYEIFTNFKFLEEMENSSDQVEHSPCQVPNLAYKQYVRKEFIDLCERMEIYPRQADVTKCTLEGGDNLRGHTRQYSSFDILVCDKESKPCADVQDVIVQIKCCKNDYECFAQVSYKGMGHYDTLYYPEFRGKHSVSVTVNNTPMAGSPFTLNVSPNQSCFADIRLEPRGIALTPHGDVLTSQWKGSKIIKLDCHGEILKEIDIGYKKLTSLALNSSGDIFVVTADEGKPGIIKCNQDGQILLMSILERSGDVHGFKNPCGVAICPKGMVYVCDRDNHGVHIFDQDLNLQNSYKLSFLRNRKKVKNDPQPTDIVFDKSGRRLIADGANCCIHVFAEDGNHFSFSTVQHGEKMGQPESIAVSNNGWILVSESDKNRVSVFQSNGEWVKTLEREGSVGELKFLSGVAVDEDETVFICDSSNNRIIMMSL